MDWYDWFKGTFKTSLFLTMNDSVFLQSFSLWQSAQFQKDKTAESIEYITVTQFYILPYHGDDLDIYIYYSFLVRYYQPILQQEASLQVVFEEEGRSVEQWQERLALGDGFHLIIREDRPWMFMDPWTQVRKAHETKARGRNYCKQKKSRGKVAENYWQLKLTLSLVIKQHIGGLAFDISKQLGRHQKSRP